MKVHVIMSNSYPYAVLSKEQDANDLVEALMAAQSVMLQPYARNRIYYSVHTFELNKVGG